MISENYRAQNRQLHTLNPNYGRSGIKCAELVVQLARDLRTTDVLDYGCGKGTLAEALPFEIQEYDPAVEGKEALPAPADIVICSDVLEHVEPDFLQAVLRHLARCTKRIAYVVVHTVPAMKTLPDGRNTHLIQKAGPWWRTQLEAHFNVHDSVYTETEAHFILKPTRLRLVINWIKGSISTRRGKRGRVALAAQQDRRLPAG